MACKCVTTCHDKNVIHNSMTRGKKTKKQNKTKTNEEKLI
jgi:hypothetical protein